MSPSAVSAMLASSQSLINTCDRAVRSQDFIQRGRRLVEQGLLTLGPFEPVPAHGFSDWQHDPLRNRSWQWRLNWLSFIPHLLAYHQASGDPRAFNMGIEAACSWLRHFGSPQKSTRHSFEFAWHDHATALRAEQFALLIHYAENRSLWEMDGARDAQGRLTDACLRHAELLNEDSFFSRHTNHGLEQARVLLLLGSALSAERAEAPMAWRQCALDRIAGELRHAFTDEGVHVENSPAYHAFVFKVFLGIIEDYDSESLGPLNRWLAEVGTKALDYLTHVLRPDGVLPIIGDTEALPVSDTFKSAFEGKPAYERFLHAISKGRKGTSPTDLHRVFPNSGYAIFRSEWPKPEHFQRPLHLVFKAGALSAYHRQQDDGHVVAWCNGEDWLIDSGLFNYDNKSPIRRYVRSRQGHNTVVIDRPFVERHNADPKACWRVLAASDDMEQPFITAENTLYPGVRMTRRVSCSRRRWFRVEDNVVATDDKPLDASILWHLPSDKKIDIFASREVLALSKRSPAAMRIRLQGDLPDEVVCTSGVEGTNVHSIVSNLANKHEPSQVLKFVFRRRASVCLQFEFSFEVQS